MRNIVEEFTEALSCNGIITKHSIKIYLDGDEVHLSYKFPEYRHHDDYVLNIYVVYNTVKDFADDFALFDVEDLDTIKPGQLFGRYEKGKAAIYCDLGKIAREQLHFKKDDILIYATNNIGIAHLVYTRLEKADDFIEYTKEYYLRLAN
jgi:hypothetical protein